MSGKGWVGREQRPLRSVVSEEPSYRGLKGWCDELACGHFEPESRARSRHEQRPTKRRCSACPLALPGASTKEANEARE